MIGFIRRSPLLRISIGLVLMTISIMLVGDLLFRLGNQEASAILDARKKLCESLAVQFSVLVASKDLTGMETTLTSVVRRNPDVLSAALREGDGTIMVEAGVHAKYWKDIAFDKSSPTHAQVPIFRGSERWGTIEVRFTPLMKKGFLALWSDPFMQLIGFVGIIGFVGYLLFMKRTLRHLDPAAVIPGRVKTALNVLAEGVVLTDTDNSIVLANDAFVRLVGVPSEILLGMGLSKLNWSSTVPNDDDDLKLPWEIAVKTGEGQLGSSLRLHTEDGESRSFVVNGSPILDEHGKARGALATFDDVTELEQKNDELKEMVHALHSSKEEVKRQNERLQVLATRDPLTNCLNRRAFNEECSRELAVSGRDGKPLSCIMLDIDFFKSVNDEFGHTVGDQVIQRVADIARAALRSIDIVGRYGGEEFCILLPGLTLDQGVIVAERLRQKIEDEAGTGTTFDAGRVITSSLGITSTELGASEPGKLVDQADQALYISKNGGRNQTTRADAVQEKAIATG